MSTLKTIADNNIRLLILGLIIPLMFNCIVPCDGRPTGKRGLVSPEISDSTKMSGTPDEYQSVNAILVLPKNPGPGEAFSILAVGGENIRKAKIIVSGPSNCLFGGLMILSEILLVNIGSL
jgi:hypothetical protein